MPRSGCFTSISTIARNSAIEIALPGKRGCCFCSANSQAATIVKHGFRNSEGCSDRPGRLIQRRAPLISAPITNVNTTPASATAKPINATRRTCGGPPGAACTFRRRADRGGEIAAAGERDRALERNGKLLGRLADQKGVPQPPKMRRERRDPTRFRQPTGDPVDRRVAQQRLFGSVRVGSL